MTIDRPESGLIDIYLGNKKIGVAWKSNDDGWVSGSDELGLAFPEHSSLDEAARTLAEEFAGTDVDIVSVRFRSK